MVPRFSPSKVFHAVAGPVLMAASAFLAVIPSHVQGNPIGAQVAAGQVAITQAGGTMTLAQASRHAIVNWQSFDIGAGEQLRLAQPGADAAMLARVIGNGGASQLLGSLQADGKLFLINRQGVVIGKDARIDTAAFLASTLDVADADFLDGGPMTFKGESDAGIVNLGTITAREGNVLLFAHTVKNAGEIAAPQGTAGLGAGTEVYLTSPDAPMFVIRTNLPAGAAKAGAPSVALAKEGVDNSGTIAAAQAQLEAAGGSIYDLAVNHSGIVRATGIEHRPDGRVVLTASGGTVGVSGTTVARNVDGSGGEILVGGDYRGGNPAVPNATNTVVTSTAVLDASAEGAAGAISNLKSEISNARSASGGRVIVWADQNTRFLGSLRASGAGGGFAEVSGHNFLDFRPRSAVDLGKGGTLLLDPESLRIGNFGGNNNNLSETAPVNPGDPYVFGGFGSASRLDVAALEGQLASTNVTLDTSAQTGDIQFEASFSWATASTLRVTSGNNIVFSTSADPNLTISGPNGALELYAGRRGTASDQLLGSFSLTANITQAAGATIAVNTLTIGQNTGAFNGGTPGNPTTYDNPSRSGDATFAGVLNVGTLRKDLSARTGALTATNPANQIGALETTGAGGDTGDINVFDGAGNLSVKLALPSTTATSIRAVTAGDLTLAAGTAISFADPTGDVILAATGGAFANAEGATAIGANARHLIYTATTAGKGGLGGINVGNHAYDANETFADTTSRFFFAGAAPVTVNLTYSANNASRVYGDANPAFGFSVTGFDNNIVNDVTGAPVLSTTAILASGVGGYAIDIAQGTLASANYGFVFSPGTLTVTAAPVTIGVNNATRTYGAANPAFAGTYTSGLKNGDALAALGTWSFATPATATSNASNYAITGSTTGVSANYSVSFTPGTLSVTPAPLDVSVANASRTYGSANPAFSATATGLLNGDSLAQAVPDLAFSTPATPASGVGGYAITATGTSSNYTPTFVPGTLSVTPASLLVAANNATRVYGDPDPAFSASITGLVNGDAAGVVSGLAFASSATGTSGVGNYTITPGGGTAANYTLSYAPATLAVTKAPLTVTIADATREYGHGNPAFGLGAITGLKNDDTSAVIQNLAFTATQPPNQLPGSFSAILASGTAANYDITWFAGTLSIVKATATIAAQSMARIYGDDPVTLTPPSFVGFLPVDESTARSIWSISNPDGFGRGAGTYPIEFSLSNPGLATTLGALYDIEVRPGTLTVRPAPLTIRPHDVARVYGDTNPPLTAAISGLRLTDTANVISSLSITTPATAASAAGSYAINASGATAANYAISYEPGTLTVNKAPLTVQVANATREYGDPNPPFNATLSGFRNGDSENIVSGLAVGTTATPASSVGNYSITASGATAANYTFDYRPGRLTVTPAPALVFTFADVTRVYGEPDPEFRILSVTGLKNGDTLENLPGFRLYSYTSINTFAGVYPKAIGAIHSSPNYFFLPSESGTITITKAPLEISGDFVTATYGDPLPTFGYTLNGLRRSDLPGVVAGVQVVGPAITGASLPGVYPVTITGGVAANYEITTYHNGGLILERRPITATALSATSFTGIVPKGLVVTGPAPIPGGPQYSFVGRTGVTASSPAGDYTITPDVTFSDATTRSDFDRYYDLKVTTATLTLSAAAVSPVTLNQAAVEITIVGDLPKLIPKTDPQTFQTTASDVRVSAPMTVPAAERALTPVLTTNYGHPEFEWDPYYSFKMPSDFALWMKSDSAKDFVAEKIITWIVSVGGEPAPDLAALFEKAAEVFNAKTYAETVTAEVIPFELKEEQASNLKGVIDKRGPRALADTNPAHYVPADSKLLLLDFTDPFTAPALKKAFIIVLTDTFGS